MNIPEVSVLFPAYNAEKYLHEAIESILSQTFKNFELIIVDDGSTDNTRIIIEEYVKKDPRVIPLFNERNLGIVQSLNKALKIAKGRYIARMDHDDISLPERLETQVRFLQEHPEISIVGSNVILINEKGEYIGIRKLPEIPEKIAKLMVLGNQFVHPTVMIRREVFDVVGNYQKVLHAEDYDLWINAIKKGLKLYNLQTPLLKYRIIDPDKITLKHRIRCGISTLKIKMMAWKSINHRLSLIIFSLNIIKEILWLFVYLLLPQSLFYKIFSFRVKTMYSDRGMFSADTISAISVSFNNAITKGIYHIVPFVVIYSLPVGRATDLPIYLYELYIFLSWTLMQSYEYIFTGYIAEKTSKFSLKTILSRAIRKTFLFSSIIYIVYIFILFFLLTKISGFNERENIRILKEIAFMGIGFPFGTGASVLVAGMIVRRMFFPTTLAVLCGIITYSLLFIYFKNYLGSEAFFISFIINEIVKFFILFLFIRSILKNEEIKSDYHEDSIVWKNIMVYFMSAVISGLIPLVLHSYATHLNEGAVSVLSYSLRLLYVLGGIFNGAISFLLVLWIEKKGKDSMYIFFHSIDKNIRMLLIITIGLSLFTIVFKEPFLSFISSNKDVIFMFSKGINIIFFCFPFFVLYPILIRVFIAIKKVHLITILSVLKLFIAISVLQIWYYIEGLNTYAPLVTFSISEGITAIVAYSLYIYFRNEMTSNAK